MAKMAGSGSGSISQRHGSADLDPYQNVMDTEHCLKERIEYRKRLLFINTIKLNLDPYYSKMWIHILIKNQCGSATLSRRSMKRRK
jgi:hypothetical protein